MSQNAMLMDPWKPALAVSIGLSRDSGCLLGFPFVLEPAPSPSWFSHQALNNWSGSPMSPRLLSFPFSHLPSPLQSLVHVAQLSLVTGAQAGLCILPGEL